MMLKGLAFVSALVLGVLAVVIMVGQPRTQGVMLQAVPQKNLIIVQNGSGLLSQPKTAETLDYESPVKNLLKGSAMSSLDQVDAAVRQFEVRADHLSETAIQKQMTRTCSGDF